MSELDFDVVIVGSGFGGSVTAYRVAQAGFRVCVLERGRSYPPNSFARSPHAFNRNFWDPGSGSLGLFDIWSFEHIDSVVSAGLGGGSLIYANVLLRKDAAWFQSTREGKQVPWPLTREELDPHYDSVEAVLRPQTYPFGHEPYASVPKAKQFRDAAIALGFEETTYSEIDATKRQWFTPPLAVSFANEGRPPVPGEHLEEDVRNLHDRDRQTCRLCGECDIGCNYGAKNTLDYNYLTLASSTYGAVLRPLAEVTAFAPIAEAEGFEVTYLQHDPKTGSAEERSVTAEHLVLSAGTFGTNRLMLKNAKALPDVSSQLGRHFSGNGDLLTIVLDAATKVDGHSRSRFLDPSYGPVISSTLRVPDTADGGEGHGFYLQDAGFPGFLEWIVQMGEVGSTAKGLLRFLWQRIADHWFDHGSPHLAQGLAGILSDTSLSAASLPLLGMGLDEPTGTFFIDDDGELQLDWSKEGSADFFESVTDVSRDMAHQMGGRFVQNPLTEYFKRLITVHGLGGCSMGTSPEDGVVDTSGRVFGCPRLHIADGSVLPSAVGANPSLTIAAVADRFADGLIADLQTAAGSERAAVPE